jgi:hypothetical protein
MGLRSHGGCVVGDGGVGAGVSMIVVLWMLVLVIAYYMRRDYYIVSTVYIHFFTHFTRFSYMSDIHQVILYDFWDFTTISGISLRFLGDFCQQAMKADFRRHSRCDR